MKKQALVPKVFDLQRDHILERINYLMATYLEFGGKC